jgi:gamma-glutamylcyclotransferase (GGCT)/AIG2-like uncharacterized protein YtfP
MKDYLFVYGTLLPDRAPEEVRDVVARLTPVASGYMLGRVYDFGEFPGAVYDSAAATRVFGRVFELPGGEASLQQLDAYEEYRPNDLEHSLFVRQRLPITLADGSELLCWVYVVNREPSSECLVPGGDYSAWVRGQSRRPA